MKFGDRRFDAAVAVSLTIAAIRLNYLSTTSAGGLWRDEANTVALATLPRVADVWKNLQFDSFPVVWLAIVRGFAALAGAGNDSAFRVLGFLLGLGMVAALWVNARSFGYRFPIVALSLIAVAPAVVRWGDSMRAYGLGMVLIVLTMAAVWTYISEQSLRALIVAGVLAVLSVNTIYYNSVLLFAICAGAAVVCIRRRQLAAAARIVGIGIVSAVSLTPYLSTIRGTSDWNALVHIPAYTTEWFFLKLYETLSPAGSWMFVVWIFLFLACVAIGTLAATTSAFHLADKQKDNATFATVTLVVGTVGSFLFLRSLSYSTQPWYYLTLLLIAGVSMDIILGSIAVSGRSRAILGTAALAFGIASALVGSSYLSTRLTNADLVAAQLESISGPRDIIIVNPWYDGVSFDRYYHGSAAWLTVPPVSLHKLHRYDLVMGLTRLPPGVAMLPVIDEAKRALKGGATVYIVGTVPKSASGIVHRSQNRYVAADDSLQVKWAAELADSINAHAGTSTSVPVNSSRPVSRYEAMTVTALRGWR